MRDLARWVDTARTLSMPDRKSQALTLVDHELAQTVVPQAVGAVERVLGLADRYETMARFAATPEAGNVHRLAANEIREEVHTAIREGRP